MSAESRAVATAYGHALADLDGVARPHTVAAIRAYVAALHAEAAMLRIKGNRLRAAASLEAYVIDRLRSNRDMTPAELGALVVEYLRGRL